MSKPLLFVSTNQHKLEEIKSMLPQDYAVKNLKDIGWEEEIPEPHDTFEENAAAKVSYFFRSTNTPSFAEDSGLVIDALGGRPGVFSARYAGIHGDNQKNIDKVLEEMKGVDMRSASFVSVIAFQPGENNIHYFIGKVKGRITEKVMGSGGFGYDPIFIPDGFSESFGMLPVSLKNKISHRSKSMDQFLEFLKNN